MSQGGGIGQLVFVASPCIESRATSSPLDARSSRRISPPPVGSRTNVRPARRSPRLVGPTGRPPWAGCRRGPARRHEERQRVAARCSAGTSSGSPYSGSRDGAPAASSRPATAASTASCAEGPGPSFVRSCLCHARMNRWFGMPLPDTAGSRRQCDGPTGNQHTDPAWRASRRHLRSLAIQSC